MYGSYYDTHFQVDPNAEYKAAHEAGVCPECHSKLIDGRCTGEGQCSRWRPVRDTIQFDDEPEDDSCPRCQDPVPGDQHQHHQVNGRWIPCNGRYCQYCPTEAEVLQAIADEAAQTMHDEHAAGAHQHSYQPECRECINPKRPLTEKQLQQRRNAAKAGGRARAKQFTAEGQAAAARCRTSESFSLSGKKGAQVTLERYGPAKLVEVLAAWRMDHPSRPEQAMCDLLMANEFVPVGDSSAAHVEEFEREVPVDESGLLRLDFGSRHWRWAIEVRGGCHDVWDDPQHEVQRLATIREAGWNVLVVSDSDLVNSRGKARYAWGLERLVKDHIASAIGDWFGQYRQANPVPFTTYGSVPAEADDLSDIPF